MLAPLALGFALLQSDAFQTIASTYEVKVEAIQQPLNWKGAGYSVTASPAKEEQLKAYEAVFVREWTLYPPSYVKKAIVHRIVFGVDLAVDGQARAAVPAYDGYTMYYDPALGSYNSHYQRVVIHHELFHMVDRRMSLVYSDPEWEKLNPPDFHYGSGGARMREAGVGELTDKIPGFLTPYGTAAVEEDKAELFAHMIVDGPYVKLRASKDPLLAAKIALLKKRLAKFDPAIDEAFWKKVYRSW